MGKSKTVSNKSEKKDDKKKVKVSKKDAEKLKKNVSKKSGSSKKDEKSTPKKEKVDKYSYIKTGKGPNKNTIEAGLTLNVVSTKKYLNKYINNNFGPNVPTINLQYAAAAVTELFLLNLVEQTLQFATKEKTKANLYNVTLENVKRTVREDRDLNGSFGTLLDAFDSKALDHTSNFIEDREWLTTFIDAKALGGTSQISFEYDALNLLVYLTMTNLNRHIQLANTLRAYAEKSSIDFRSLLFANKSLLTGTYLKKCQMKLEELETKFSGRKKTDEDSKAETEHNDDDDDDGSDKEASDDEGSDEDGSDEESGEESD